MFSNVDTFSVDKQLELSERLKIMERTPQIIALQEVKPKNSRYAKSAEEYKLDGYNIMEYNIDANEGRGLLLYVRRDVVCNTVELSTDYCEHSSIEVKTSEGNSAIVTSIYRSPNSSVENNGRLLQLLEEINDTSFKYKLVVGDFNLPTIDWNNCTTDEGLHGFSAMFVEKIRDCFYTQHIKDITRMRGKSRGNTLDLVFSNDETIVEEIQLTSPLGRSDHVCIEIMCDLQDMEVKVKDMYYMYEKADYNRMKRSLDIDWEHYLPAYLSTDQKWRKFVVKLKEVIDDCVPKRKFIGRQNMRKRTNYNLPMSRKLWTKIKRKQRLWAKLSELKKNRGALNGREYAEIETQYRRLNNQIRRETRNAIKLKEEIAKHVKENPKIFWIYVSSKPRTKSRIVDLYVDENNLVKTTSDKEKAMVFAEKFSSVFVKETEEEVPRISPRNVPILENMEITRDMLWKVLQKLNRSKSPGPDGIHPRIIKDTAEELIVPLEIIFMSSLNEGVVPEDWRTANITPIFKKGSKSDPGNYRPVSLTSIFSKLMEAVLREAIIEYMKVLNLFSCKQLGFISGRSTVLQLIQVIDKWTEAIDEGEAIGVVYCDFMKTFDRVPHKRLLAKIKSYGIGGTLLQ